MQMQLIYKGHKTLQSSPFFIITNEGLKKPWSPSGKESTHLPTGQPFQCWQRGLIKVGTLTCIKNQTLKKKKFDALCTPAWPKVRLQDEKWPLLPIKGYIILSLDLFEKRG